MADLSTPEGKLVERDIVREICGDERNGGIIRDMAYTVWHNCHNPSYDDGNSDWGNDNLPLVNLAVERIRDALSRIAAERDEARLLVTEANNSLYGSQGYFHSLDGGPFDKYHLANGIEKLKAHGRDQWRKSEAAERERDELKAALSAMVQRFELYAGPNDINAGHHDLALLKSARAALRTPEESP